MAKVVRNSKPAISLCFLIFLILSVKPCKSQQGTINLQKQVTILSASIQLDSLLSLIKKQTGAKFSLNSRKFPASKRIHIKNHTQSIEGILQEIKQNTGVYYTILGDHIILLDNPPPTKTKEAEVIHTAPPVDRSEKKSVPQKRIPPPGKHITVKTTVPTGKSNVPGKNATGASQKSISFSGHLSPRPVDTAWLTTTDTVSRTIPVGDTLPLPSVASLQKKLLLSKTTAAKSTPANNIKTPSAARNKKERSFFVGNPFVKAGIATDDVLYGGATIQAGLPYVYGIGSWNTNFKISGFRYGAGVSIPLHDEWKLHVQFTTGHLSSKVGMDTFPIITQEIREVKTQLHRAGIIAETTLGNHFILQFGPVLNIMKAALYQNGKKTLFGVSEETAEKKYNVIHSLYTISNNYSTASSHFTKIWIGLQVGIFYSINFLRSQ